MTLSTRNDGIDNVDTYLCSGEHCPAVLTNAPARSPSMVPRGECRRVSLGPTGPCGDFKAQNRSVSGGHVHRKRQECWKRSRTKCREQGILAVQGVGSIKHDSAKRSDK
jgi:hypothetical protein